MFRAEELCGWYPSSNTVHFYTMCLKGTLAHNSFQRLLYCEELLRSFEEAKTNVFLSIFCWCLAILWLSPQRQWSTGIFSKNLITRRSYSALEEFIYHMAASEDPKKDIPCLVGGNQCTSYNTELQLCVVDQKKCVSCQARRFLQNKGFFERD
jgi:hypothetical protein